jgi:hypothetical protein
LSLTRYGNTPILGLRTLDVEKSQLTDRVHTNPDHLEGTSDDELDLLLGDAAELHVNAGSNKIEQLL